ncbi:MAG: NAD(P)-dependent oxidoreductase [Salinivirgaceae bacterium]|jgi:lactate dehydrogenase-like 2-hydroxyacid dehydrogenase|nr:NAD(P)-dependent oxidoreductase [Salinivirgaceae bacterium]
MNIHLIEPLSVEQKIIDQNEHMLNENGLTLKQWRDRKEDTNSLIERCKDADVVILTNIALNAEVINACPNLKMISVAFTGVDHIDMDACREKGIVVSNAAGYSTHSVAELTIGLMFSALRNMMKNETKTRNLRGRDGYTGALLRGKTVGIVGAGAIGQEVGRICKVAFNCNVLYYNRSKKPTDSGTLVPLNELLKRSDIVTLHLPLNSESKGLIGEEQLALMEPSSILINTARGPVVDTNALVQALKKDSIGHAAIDMYEQEPPLPENHPLLSTPNTTLMPHIAYATHEAFVLRAEIVFENILKWKHGTPQNVQ